MRETLTAFDQMILDTLKLLNSIANKIILNNSVSVFQDVNKQSYICTEASHSPQILLYLKKKNHRMIVVEKEIWSGDQPLPAPVLKQVHPAQDFVQAAFEYL